MYNNSVKRKGKGSSKMARAIYFDMDGTFVDFYGVDGWLDYLQQNDATPYIIAKPLVNMSAFARQVKRLQRAGYTVGIVSWCSKNGNSVFDEMIEIAKKDWLMRHCPSIKWDEIKIVPYGTSKHKVVKHFDGLLFDDEEKNRLEWDLASTDGFAFDVIDLMKTLRRIK